MYIRLIRFIEVHLEQVITRLVRMKQGDIRDSYHVKWFPLTECKVVAFETQTYLP
jgi:hypothetical protein